MNIEEKPLHEVILDIMYFKDTEKPAQFTTEDLFWQMKDPDISENQIKEVLEWLVRQKKVEYKFGKYKIDKYEFIDLSQKYDNIVNDKSPVSNSKETLVGREIKVAVQKTNNDKNYKDKRFYFVYLFLILSALCIFYAMYNLLTIKPIEYKSHINKVEVFSPHPLYVSTSSNKHIDEKIKGISYSFTKQNESNKMVQNQVDSLNYNIDHVINELINLRNEIISQREAENKSLFALGLCIILLIFSVFSIKKTSK